MNSENNCAKSIRLIEGEEFLAVASQVYPYLNPDHQKERLQGLSQKLPDLLSVKREGNKSYYRIREVKFKLEERLVLKAVTQLKRGAQYLLLKEPSAEIDRLELVIFLHSRELKVSEKLLIGESLGGRRYRLNLSDRPVFLELDGMQFEVTVLFI